MASGLPGEILFYAPGDHSGLISLIAAHSYNQSSPFGARKGADRGFVSTTLTTHNNTSFNLFFFCECKEPNQFFYSCQLLCNILLTDTTYCFEINKIWHLQPPLGRAAAIYGCCLGHTFYGSTRAIEYHPDEPFNDPGNQ